MMKKGILYSAIIASLLIGCGNDNKQEETKSVATTEKPAPATSNASTQKAVSTQKAEPTTKKEMKCGAGKCGASMAKDTVKKVENNAKEVVKQAKEAVKPTVEKAKEVASKAVEKVKQEAAPVVEKAKEVKNQVANVVSKVKEAVAPSVDGKAIFVTCSGCHGAKAEKKALGVGHVIAGWDASKIENALKGYKAGTYGGAMKGVMQGQAAKLDDAKIKAVAKYISTLK